MTVAIAAPYSRTGISQLRKRDRLDFVAGLGLWAISGTPVLAILSNGDAALVIAAIAYAAYGSLSGWQHRYRARAIWVLPIILVCWTLLRSISVGTADLVGLLGHLIKIFCAVSFVISARRPVTTLVDTMVWISGVALVIFGARQFLGLVGLDLGSLFSWVNFSAASSSDHSILIFNFDQASEFYRNSGPFREPGMFASYLAISLIFALGPAYDREGRARHLRFAVLLAALVSTQSTMGMATIPLIALIALIEAPKAGYGRAFGLVALVILSMVVLWLWFNGGHGDKLSYQTSIVATQSNTWYQSRLGNGYIDWIAIRERPWLGYGFSELGRPTFWFGQLANQGFGNGLTGTAVKFGIPTAVCTIFLLFMGLRGVLKNMTSILVACVVLVVLLIGQQLITLPVIFVLLGGLATTQARLQRRKTISPRFARDQASPWRSRA